MPEYHLACQEDDGSWTVHEFRAEDDPSAISCGLQMRTCNRCELYCNVRCIASFDGLSVADESNECAANDNITDTNLNIETELAYFQRRALTQRELARTGQSPLAKLSHLRMAEHLESLARAFQAEQRRLCFYDVNAGHASIGLG
jgi:hypothetical protein